MREHISPRRGARERWTATPSGENDIVFHFSSKLNDFMNPFLSFEMSYHFSACNHRRPPRTTGNMWPSCTLHNAAAGEALARRRETARCAASTRRQARGCAGAGERKPSASARRRWRVCAVRRRAEAVPYVCVQKPLGLPPWPKTRDLCWLATCVDYGRIHQAAAAARSICTFAVEARVAQ
jgi:hypothetical protein